MKRVISDPIGAGFVLNFALLTVYALLIATQWIMGTLL